MTMDVYGVPAHIQQGLRLYITAGIRPGDFLLAALANDLAVAASYADPESLAGLPGLMRFLVNEVPHIAWGSRDAVASWLQLEPEKRAGIVRMANLDDLA